MIPIFEQGKGNGLGHSYNTFLSRFVEICEEHLNNGRAKSFAFIIYDFHNKDIRNVLKNQGGFTRLDRLSGNTLSIFYLHSDNRRLITEFNNTFLGIFDIPVEKRTTPFVMFFNLSNGCVDNVNIIELEQDNIMFAFNDLYNIIEANIKETEKSIHKTPNLFIKLLHKTTGIAVEKIIEKVIDNIAESNFIY